MAASRGVRFIRVGGRVIPIRSKDYDRGVHTSSLKLGALAGASALASKAAKSPHLKLGLSAASGIAGAALLVHQIRSSVNHGNKKKSFLSGAGSFITQSYVGAVGTLAGTAAAGYGLRKSFKAAKSLKSYNLARRAAKAGFTIIK